MYILFLILCEVIFIAPLETESFIQLCTNAFLVLLSGFKTHQNTMVASVQKYGLYLLIKLGKKPSRKKVNFLFLQCLLPKYFGYLRTIQTWEKISSFSDPPAFLNSVQTAVNMVWYTKNIPAMKNIIPDSLILFSCIS